MPANSPVITFARLSAMNCWGEVLAKGFASLREGQDGLYAVNDPMVVAHAEGFIDHFEVKARGVTTPGITGTPTVNGHCVTL